MVICVHSEEAWLYFLSSTFSNLPFPPMPPSCERRPLSFYDAVPASNEASLLLGCTLARSPFAAPHRSSFGTHLSPDSTSFTTASSVTMLRDATIVRHRCVRLRGNPLRVYCTREKKNKGNGAFTVKCFAVMPLKFEAPTSRSGPGQSI